MIDIVKVDIEKANDNLLQLLEDMEDDEEVMQSDIYKQAKEFLDEM